MIGAAATVLGAVRTYSGPNNNPAPPTAVTTAVLTADAPDAVRSAATP